MTGVLGGLAAAVLWGVSSAVAARSSRLIGAEAALGWVYLVGLAVAVPAAFATGLPDLDGEGLRWLAVTAPAAISSLYLMYAAVKRGPVALVMPIAASQGGVAALIAVGLGEDLEPLAAAGLGVIMAGMLAAMRRPGNLDVSHSTAAVVLAALCAAISGFALYGSARTGDSLGALWTLAALRVAGVAGLTLPVALAGSLRRPGRATRLVLFCGLADTAAFASYVAAASAGSVAVPAVLSSQFAAVAALIGVAAMGERLTRVQVAGIVSILAGVALVTAVQS
jgi:drug/metabolite transporter (DMT)-like permease